MSGTTIREVRAWEALDPRGHPTVGCAVVLAGGARGRAIVPAGASTGGHEAVELRDGGERFGGLGVRDAVQSVRGELADLVRGCDATDRASIDDLLVAADVDPLLSRVGANAVLAVSLAVTLAAADGTGREVWESVLDGRDGLLPMPMVNVVSGGAHAGRAIDLQDVLVIPTGARRFADAIGWASRVRAAAAELMRERGGRPELVADEGGLAFPFASNEAALALVTDAIHRAGLEPGRDAWLAVDVAANQFHQTGAYRLAADGRTCSADELVDLLVGWGEQYPVASWEDVLHEDAWDDWRRASVRLSGAGSGGSQLLGDDLFASDASRLRRAVAEDVADAVLVKPNQAGTVTRAELLVRFAHESGYRTVLSARSGDTEDSWLADLAVGWRTGQIKVGSTMRSERTAKWNRLLEIEAVTGSSVEYAGGDALGVLPH